MAHEFGLNCFLVAAFRLRAAQHGAGLQPFLHEIWIAALGAFFRYRLAPGDEIAVRVAAAAVKSLTALGAPLDNFAFRTLRTLHSHGLLLDVLAGRVIAAGGELAETAELRHHIAAALRAFFIQRHVGLSLDASNGPGGLAIRITGAGEKLSEAALLQHHGPAAVLAVFLIALLGEIRLIDVRQIHRELPGIGALRIAGAGDEASVLAPLDD